MIFIFPYALVQSFSNSREALKLPGRLVVMRLLHLSISPIFQSLRICISKEFSGDVEAKDHTLRTPDLIETF